MENVPHAAAEVGRRIGYEISVYTSSLPRLPSSMYRCRIRSSFPLSMVHFFLNMVGSPLVQPTCRRIIFAVAQVLKADSAVLGEDDCILPCQTRLHSSANWTRQASLPADLLCPSKLGSNEDRMVLCDVERDLPPTAPLRLDHSSPTRHQHLATRLPSFQD